MSDECDIRFAKTQKANHDLVVFRKEIARGIEILQS